MGEGGRGGVSQLVGIYMYGGSASRLGIREEDSTLSAGWLVASEF